MNTTTNVTGYFYLDDQVEDLTKDLSEQQAEQITKLFCDVYKAGKADGYGAVTQPKSTSEQY